MDAATSRTIRIGKANIGLVGLDIALNIAAGKNLEEHCAVEFLYDKIKNTNYIPAGLKETYKKALHLEYRRHLNLDDAENDTLVIRIFGTGCVSCNGLQNLVIEVLAKFDLPADIEQIHDPDEIGRHGILQTPALMINGRLQSSGLLPTPSQVEQWLKEHRQSS